ncbi:MAG: DUF1015 family protein, partial [Nocardioidaceae bacterium]
MNIRPPRLRVAGGRPTPETPTVVYRLTSHGHQQTGVVVELLVDESSSERVLQHEATLPEWAPRQNDTGPELVPVTLMHPERPRLQQLLSEVTAQPPGSHAEDDAGLDQSVWALPPGAQARAIQAELDHLDVLYIADGHHRMAAATANSTANSTDCVLAAIFPSSQMRVLGYHRCVVRPVGPSTSDLLKTLDALPVTDRVEECAEGEPPDPVPGTIPTFLDGRWYALRLHPPAPADDPRESLDVVVLEEAVLVPSLGVTDVRDEAQV